MSDSPADRNVLYALLASQLGFIQVNELTEAVQTRVTDKSQSIGNIFENLAFMTSERRRLMDALIEEHLFQHGTPEESLATINGIEWLEEFTTEISDPTVESTIAHLKLKDQTALGQTQIVRHGPDQTNSKKTKHSDLRFTIIRPHARGGLGSVSIAQDTELNREVALKEIRDSHSGDEASRQRFVLEAEVTGGLEHPGIVPVYGLGYYADGSPYYAMRFVRGDSLDDAIRQFHSRSAEDSNAGDRSVELRPITWKIRRCVQCHRIRTQPWSSASRPEAWQYHARQIWRNIGCRLGIGQDIKFTRRCPRNGRTIAPASFCKRFGAHPSWNCRGNSGLHEPGTGTR